jgi:hypothetical protein
MEVDAQSGTLYQTAEYPDRPPTMLIKRQKPKNGSSSPLRILVQFTYPCIDADSNIAGASVVNLSMTIPSSYGSVTAVNAAIAHLGKVLFAGYTGANTVLTKIIAGES